MQVGGTRLLRVKAVAEMLDVSVATIYRAIEAGKLDALRIGAGEKGALRVPLHAVQAYVDSCSESGCVVEQEPLGVELSAVVVDRHGEALNSGTA